VQQLKFVSLILEAPRVSLVGEVYWLSYFPNSMTFLIILFLEVSLKEVI